MVLFSSVIVSFSTVYFSRDLFMLFSFPISTQKLFISKTIDVMLQSSWMMVLTMIPFLIAFAQVKNVNIDFFIGVIFLIIPFLFISTVIGVIISLLILYLFPSSKVRDIILVLTIIIGSIGYVLLRFLEPEKLANPDVFFDTMEYLAYLNAPVAKILPSWWITDALNSILIKKNSILLLNTIYLVSGAVLSVCLLIILSKKLYYQCWTAVQTNSNVRKKVSQIKINSSMFTNNIFYSLLIKDIKTFFRDTKQWSQILLVVALVIVYIFSIYKLPVRIAGNKEFTLFYLNDFIGFINIAGAGFILSALALRFAFPQISLERGNLWFLLFLPTDIKIVFMEKLCLACLLIIPSGLILVIITNSLLKVSTPIFFISTLTIIIISIGLTILAVGFGALYPKFSVENIAQIETSYGGLLFMLSAFVYIGLILVIESRPVQIFIYQKYVGKNYVDIVSLTGYNIIEFILINTIVIFVPIWYGIKSIRKYELREWII
jgi:ABC-2 type transport system permease protein